MGRRVSEILPDSASDGFFSIDIRVARVCVSASVDCLRFVSCVGLWMFLCRHLSTGDFFHG